MSDVDLRSALGQLFLTGWGERTPIRWPNMKFEPPLNAPYVEFSIAEGEVDRLEFGGAGAAIRNQGRVFVKVMVPVESGDKMAREMCDAIKAIFKSNRQITTSVGRILLREPGSKSIGATGTHDQTNVFVPYLYDTN